MKIFTVIYIALKNLWAHRLRTIITVVGVSIGIGSIIFLVSLGYGLEKLVTSQVANFNAFTVIDVPAANIKTIQITNETIDRIQGFGHVKTVAPVSNLAGRIKKQDSSSTTETVIVGARADYWKLADIIADKGRLPADNDEIAINQSVASLIQEDPNNIIGKKVSLEMIITGELQANGGDGVKITEDREFTVVGFLNSGQSPTVLVPLDMLASEGATQFSSLKVKVENKDNVESTRKQIENIGFSTEYVGDTVSEISQVFTLFRVILGAFGLIAMIVAALGAFNTLTISLLERVREVGLFKALGMRNKDVYKLFLAESIIIGITGGLIGLFFGTMLGNLINVILSFLAQKSGAEQIQIFITPWTFSLSVAGFSIIVGFLTGWYPSRRAVKINPLDALKYE
jgi:ABC-type lipoprotein release transport system permease subunit